MNHRWSETPLKYCIDCGCFDPVEEAIADGLVDFECDETGDIVPIIKEEIKVLYHGFKPCIEPGSDRWNSDARKSNLGELDS